jgi:hypothetical protein
MIGVGNHRPELEAIEKYAASTDPPMPEQRRPARDVCTSNDRDEQGRQKDDCKARTHDIEGTLEYWVRPTFRDRDGPVLGDIEPVAGPAIKLDNMKATEPAGAKRRRRVRRS